MIESKGDKLLLIICCSSTGQGDLPENVREFYDELSGQCLHGIEFIMLCLGDSNYTSFMEGPHKLTKGK